MRIDLTCGRCGRNRFTLPDAGGDEAIVSCSDCGHSLGTLGDMKKQVEAAVLEGGRAAKARGSPGDRPSG